MAKAEFFGIGFYVTPAVLSKADQIHAEYVCNSLDQNQGDHIEAMRRALKHIMKHARSKP